MTEYTEFDEQMTLAAAALILVEKARAYALGQETRGVLAGYESAAIRAGFAPAEVDALVGDTIRAVRAEGRASADNCGHGPVQNDRHGREGGTA